MTTAAVTPVTARTLVPVALIGALGWAALGSALLTGNDGIGLVLPVILVAVAATSYAVAGVVRSRDSDAGFVIAILSPIIVSAALTPLVATNGPAVLAWPVFALAVVLVALAVQAGRHEARGARS